MKLETKNYLEKLVSKVATDLISIYSRSNQKNSHGLIFPRKRDGSLRISEQEAKHLFVHYANSDKRFCYSVETPTTQTYRQKGSTAMSARVDLTLVGQPGEPCVNIELKAHYCGVENIRKDLEKLVRENTAGVWFHTLETGSQSRLRSLLGTFRLAFQPLADYLKKSDTSYLITICVLDAGLLYWRWLSLTGNLDGNLAAIDCVFQEGSLASGEWQVTRIGDECAGRELDTDASYKTSGISFKGKGARESFYIYAPAIATDTFMHLSGRGGSYRIRTFYLSRTAKSPGFMVPGYETLESLRSSGIVAKWLPVTAEDSKHNIIEEPGYFYERIREINKKALPPVD